MKQRTLHVRMEHEYPWYRLVLLDEHGEELSAGYNGISPEEAVKLFEKALVSEVTRPLMRHHEAPTRRYVLKQNRGWFVIEREYTDDSFDPPLWVNAGAIARFESREDARAFMVAKTEMGRL